MSEQTSKMEQDNPIKYIRLLEPKVREIFKTESSGHDIDHLQRVSRLALHLQDKEGGDGLVIGVAAYLHDIHRLTEKQTGKFNPPKESLAKVNQLLEDVNFPSDKIGIVLHCIEFHEEYGFSTKGKTVNDLETLILQDADNLDAMGAIGIGRTFAFGGANNLPMWIPERAFDRNIYDESERDPSTLHHFYSKLLKLGENMNTETARQMAKERHSFMEEFVDRFKREWNGEI